MARQIADNRGYVDDSVWALDAGCSEEEILDAYPDVIRTILTKLLRPHRRHRARPAPAP